MGSKTREIGTRIGVDGQDEFAAAMQKLDRELRVLSSEMKNATAAFEKNDKSADNLTSQNEVLTKQIQKQKDKLEVLRKALDECDESTVKGAQDADGYRIKINNAEAAIKKMTRQVEANEAALDDSGEEAKDAAKQLDKAGKAAKDSGADAEKGSSGWSKMGSAIKVAATAIAAATAAAVAGVVKLSENAAAYADEIKTLSAQTGLSTKDLQLFKQTAELTDVELETMTGSMAKLTRNMQSAKNGSKNTQAAFDALGVQIVDSTGQLRNNQIVFAEAMTALGKMENETQRDAYAMQIFGKSAQDLNPLIKGGAEVLAKYAAEAEKTGLIMDDISLNKLGDLDDSIQTMKANISGFGNVLALAFSDKIKGAVDGITSAVKKLSSAYKSGGLGGMLSEIQTMLSEGANKIAQGIPDFTKKLIEALPGAVNTGVQLATSLISGIAQSAPELAKSAVDAVLTICESLLSEESITELLDAAVGLIEGLAVGLIDALPKLLEKGPDIVIGLINGIVAAVPKLGDAAVNIIGKLVEFLTDPNSIRKLAEGSLEVVGALVAGIGDAVVEWVKLGPKLYNRLKEVFTNTDWETLGKNIWNGICNGFMSAIESLKGVGDKIVGFFNGELEIHSPSRKLRRKTGKFAGMGFGLGFFDGFEYEMSALSQKMGRAVPSLSPEGRSYDTGSTYGTPQYVYNVLEVDGREVGTIITPYVSRAQGLALARG